MKKLFTHTDPVTVRAFIFRKILQKAKHQTPGFIKRIQLQLLLNLTADSFRMKKRMIWHLSSDHALAEYAKYTRYCMKYGTRDSKRLYQYSLALGRKLRCLTGFTSPSDRQKLIFWLYQNIGIRMEGDFSSSIIMSECYFSHFYGPQHCRCISAIDSGIIAGILGDGRLIFTSRITEGNSCCQACFTHCNKHHEIKPSCNQNKGN